MIQYEEFNLKQEYFNHKSWLHGIQHTYRVMAHVVLLGRLSGLENEGRLAFFSAFIHDMARKNDWVCSRHGAWAVEKKLPVFKPLFSRYGLTHQDYTGIETAVTFHSLHEELRPTHPHYNVTALLKDADALDRFRMGDHDLDISYLRIPESVTLLPYARELFLRSEELRPATFTEMLRLADTLSDTTGFLS